jgi:hypothetical protein
MKKFLIVMIFGLFILGTVYVFFQRLQPTPDEIFTKKLLGTWGNFYSYKDVWLKLNENRKCIYHQDEKDVKCIYQVHNKILIVAISMKQDITKAISKGMNNKEVNFQHNIEFGFKIFDIKLEENKLTAKMSSVSGVRETIPRIIHLKRINK